MIHGAIVITLIMIDALMCCVSVGNSGDSCGDGHEGADGGGDGGGHDSASSSDGDVCACGDGGGVDRKGYDGRLGGGRPSWIGINFATCVEFLQMWRLRRGVWDDGCG